MWSGILKYLEEGMYVFLLCLIFLMSNPPSFVFCLQPGRSLSESAVDYHTVSVSAYQHGHEDEDERDDSELGVRMLVSSDDRLGQVPVGSARHVRRATDPGALGGSGGALGDGGGTGVLRTRLSRLSEVREERDGGGGELEYGEYGEKTYINGRGDVRQVSGGGARDRAGYAAQGDEQLGEGSGLSSGLGGYGYGIRDGNGVGGSRQRMGSEAPMSPPPPSYRTGPLSTSGKSRRSYFSAK